MTVFNMHVQEDQVVYHVPCPVLCMRVSLSRTELYGPYANIPTKPNALILHLKSCRDTSEHQWSEAELVFPVFVLFKAPFMCLLLTPTENSVHHQHNVCCRTQCLRFSFNHTHFFQLNTLINSGISHVIEVQWVGYGISCLLWDTDQIFSNIPLFVNDSSVHHSPFKNKKSICNLSSKRKYLLK